jgi:hypothetical protein
MIGGFPSLRKKTKHTIIMLLLLIVAKRNMYLKWFKIKLSYIYYIQIF